MKNLLPEQPASTTHSRGCLTLDPRDANNQLPPLMEQRSSLLNKACSGRPPRKVNSSEPKLKRPQQQNHQSLIIHFETPNDESVDKLLHLLLDKGKKVPEFVQANGLADTCFLDQHFRSSPVVFGMQRAHLRTVLQKFISKGQVGADLKGVNKPILEKIEATLKEVLDNQKELYQVKSHFHKQSSHISKGLSQYRAKIMKSLGQLDTITNIR